MSDELLDNKPTLTNEKTDTNLTEVQDAVNSLVNVYQVLGDQADQLFFKGNYTEAAERYHELSMFAPDNESKFDSLCYEGRCYYYISRNDNDESVRNSALKNATRIFSELTGEDSDYKNYSFYPFAVAYLSHIYHDKNYTSKNKEWAALISYLEEVANKNEYDLSDNLGHEVMKSVYSSLLEYYLSIDESVPAVFIPEYNDKIQKCYSSLIEISKANPGPQSVDSIDEDARFYGLMSDAMIDQSFLLHNDEATQKALAENAINLCDSLLSTFNLTPDTEYAYMLLNRVIVKGTFYLGLYSKDDHDEYWDKVHKISRNLIRTPISQSDGAKSERSTLTFYFMMTGNCTQEDIDYAVKALQSYLDTDAFNNEPEYRKKVSTVYTTASTCKEFLERYDYNENAYRLGIEMSDMLKDNKSVISDKNFLSGGDGRDPIQEIIDYFDTYVPEE